MSDKALAARGYVVVTVALLTLITGIPAASAASPLGPRLATVQMIETKGSEREENASAPFMALTTFGASGERRRYLLKERWDRARKRVVPDAFPEGPPSWSADGSTVAFLASQGRRHRGIYLAEAAARRVRFVRGTMSGADLTSSPVLSPDGATLVFARWRTHFPDPPDPSEPGRKKTRERFYSSMTTWAISFDGGPPRRLTPWRNYLQLTPSSFSPDGMTLALTKEAKGEGPAVVLMDMDGSGSETVIDLAKEPSISPDGSRVAFIGYRDQSFFEEDETHKYSLGELYVANIDGGGIRRLTRSETVAESSPSWNPSGSRIAYVGLSTATRDFSFFDFLFPTGNSIMQINADGTCPTRIFSDPKIANYGVAWQPGPGRGAGPIAC